jgi:uncharacterized protein YdeI (YjbR/CyaY-like superfamily)
VTPRFFKTPAAFRQWLAANYAKSKELWVGFYKKDSGKPSITWPESVDEALCFGWIDGVRKSLDAESYVIRFSPRKPTSIWSAVNIRNVERLIKEDLMQDAGMRAFAARKDNRSGIYAYEQRSPELVEPYLSTLKTNKAAWKFFSAQPPGYRKMMNWWIVSAKREDTRLERLAKLIKASENSERIR